MDRINDVKALWLYTHTHTHTHTHTGTFTDKGGGAKIML